MKKAIIIDNFKSVRRTFGRILEKEGFETYKTKSAKEALEIIREGCIDLALVDCEGLGENSKNIITEMKRLYPRSVGIVVTSDPEYLLHKNGADNYFLKPVKAGDLLSFIQEKFGKKTPCSL